MFTLRFNESYAADVEVCPNKPSDRLTSRRLQFDGAHLIFPEVFADAEITALVVDVQAIAWSSNESLVRVATANALELSLAIAHKSMMAFATQEAHRADLVTAMLPIETWGSSFVVPIWSDDLRALFAPPGYDVGIIEHASSSASSSVERNAQQLVRLVKPWTSYEVLSHAHVFGTVLAA